MKRTRGWILAIPLLSLIACVDVVGDADEQDVDAEAADEVVVPPARVSDTGPTVTPTTPPRPPGGGGGGCAVRNPATPGMRC